MDVWFRVMNILDEKYEVTVNYPQLGRSYYFGIKGKFLIIFYFSHEILNFVTIGLEHNYFMRVGVQVLSFMLFVLVSCQAETAQYKSNLNRDIYELGAEDSDLEKSSLGPIDTLVSKMLFSWT